MAKGCAETPGSGRQEIRMKPGIFSITGMQVAQQLSVRKRSQQDAQQS